MGYRAVLFAVSNRDLQKLLSARLAGDRDKAVWNVVQEIEARWEKEWLQELDKSWEAIHRCLTDGKFEFGNGEYPLNLCILNGLQLYDKEGYIVSLKSSKECVDIANSLEQINEEWLANRYKTIDPNDYAKSEDDFEYTWSWFKYLPEFYAKAAQANRSVVFSVDY